MSKPSYVVISYVPLLVPTKDMSMPIDASDKAALEKFSKMMEGSHNNVADGLAWTINSEPVFIIKDALKIAKHIEVWTESDPANWFDLWWYEKDGRYSVTLMPRIQQSIDRFRARMKLHFGQKIDKDARFNVLFQPIQFVSDVVGPTTTFHKVKDHVPELVKVGFMEYCEPYFINQHVGGAEFNWTHGEKKYCESIFENPNLKKTGGLR